MRGDRRADARPANGPKTLISLRKQLGEAIDDARDGRDKGVVVIPAGFSHAVAEVDRTDRLFTDNVDAISSGTLKVLAQAAATST